MSVFLFKKHPNDSTKYIIKNTDGTKCIKNSKVEIITDNEKTCDKIKVTSMMFSTGSGDSCIVYKDPFHCLYPDSSGTCMKFRCSNVEDIL